jgi:serine/threonine-protein kinase
VPTTEPRLSGTIEELPGYIGKILLGKYVVLGGLGAGAMGTVYEAENLSVGKHVALKILRREYVGSEEVIGRFQREARAAARIGHPNIVDVLDMGRTEDGLPFIVMECLEGQDLFALLAERGPLPIARAVDIIMQVLSALGAAHAVGILHRDLKPENVFLSQRPRPDFVKVLDFGVAKFADTPDSAASRLTRGGTVVGTPAYMSPEQARGAADLDARSDLYAAGVLLYEMLTGRTPHEGENYNEMMFRIVSEDARPLAMAAPSLPAELGEVVDRCLAREPEQRFQSAAELIAALQPFAGIETAAPVPLVRLKSRSVSPSAPTASVEETRAPSTIGAASARSRVVWILAAVAVLVAVAGLLSLRREASSARPRAPAARSRTPVSSSAPTAPAAPSVSLDVTSNVPGARVLLDGTLLGQAPLQALVPQGASARVLRVEAAVHEPAERTIELSGPVRIHVDLAPLVPVETGPVPPRPALGKDASKRKRGRLLFDDL